MLITDSINYINVVRLNRVEQIHSFESKLTLFRGSEAGLNHSHNHGVAPPFIIDFKLHWWTRSKQNEILDTALFNKT